MTEQIPFMDDLPGGSRGGAGRYNRDQRVLRSLLMLFGLIFVGILLVWLL